MNDVFAYSVAFELLDERIQRFIWSEGWDELHEVQERAIPLILEGQHDVIIAAATASGKTEAAFLPALTRLLATRGPGLIVYVSPLKALINDQFRRLNALCEHLHVPVWAWHGDIAASQKARFAKSAHGVLLITPESLEATLCTRGAASAGMFRHALYVVVDELHAFIGSERGKQLQSLLHRLERLIARSVPRVGLSATLGDMSIAAEFLRAGGRCDIVDVKGGAQLKVLLKGHGLTGRTDSEPTMSAPAAVVPHADHLFSVLRGTNNLVFPNSRAEVERYTSVLNEMCSNVGLSQEFWPHHGSLSKDVRLETERAIKQRERPATAVCTNTLELGIDIGAVRSVAQIGPPPSVSSLRQRLGRSGRRRGDSAILWGYTTEVAAGAGASIRDSLRLETVEFIAMIQLMAEGCMEPPPAGARHFSTLVQQILAVIAQNSGICALDLFEVLCGSGAPFAGIARASFSDLLKHLGAKKLLEQDSAGSLLLGALGEKLVSHYTFYAAFAEEDEYRILCSERVLGTLPVTSGLSPGERLLFAGKTWVVDGVSEPKKTISVSPASGGAPPSFSGGGSRTHSLVRQRMQKLLAGAEQPAFLDEVAMRFLLEGREQFAAMQLGTKTLVELESEVLVFTWLGDTANQALAYLVRRRGFHATVDGPAVAVTKQDGGLQEVEELLATFAHAAPPDVSVLLAGVKNLKREKWDWAVPESLLREGYASQNLDLREALAWLQRYRDQIKRDAGRAANL